MDLPDQEIVNPLEVRAQSALNKIQGQGYKSYYLENEGLKTHSKEIKIEMKLENTLPE